MANITVSPREMAVVTAWEQITVPTAPGVNIQPGQVVSINSGTGRAYLANATVADIAMEVAGIAVSDGRAGVVTILRRGVLDLGEGSLAGIEYNAPLYLSDDDGRISTEAGSTPIRLGGVIPGWAHRAGSRLMRVEIAVEATSSSDEDTTLIPEIALTYEVAISMPADAKSVYLPINRYYEVGRNAIVLYEYNGEDRTGERGIVWDEVARSIYGGNTRDLSSVNSTSWMLRRLEGYRDAVTVRVRWVERVIAHNPLRVTAVVENNGSLDTSLVWTERYPRAVSAYGNVNAMLIDGVPDGYQVEVWRLTRKRRSRGKSSQPHRGRRWRPLMRLSPEQGRVLVRADAIARRFFALGAVALYNPATGARSVLSAPFSIHRTLSDGLGFVRVFY